MTGTVLVIPDLQSDELREIPIEPDTLRMLYREIGCTSIDLVRLGDHPVPGLDLYVDDEGLLKEAPQYNVRAMALILATTGALHQSYVGHAVVTRSDDEGETIGLTPGQIRRVRAAISKCSPVFETWAGEQSVRRS